jgi:hypothetical protein
VTGPLSAPQVALRACLQQSVRTANWLVCGFAGVAAAVVFGGELHALGPWIVIAASAAGAAVAVRLGICRARKLAAALPPAEAAEVLRPFARHDDEIARHVAAALLNALPAPSTELIAATAPLPSRGDEPVPAA